MAAKLLRQIGPPAVTPGGGSCPQQGIRSTPDLESKGLLVVGYAQG